MRKDSTLLPAVAGLLTGIALIIILSLTLKTTLPLTDDQIIASANRFSESKIFLAKFADTEVNVDRTGVYGTAPKVIYQYENVDSDGRRIQARMLFELNTLTGMPSHGTINIFCAETFADGTGMKSYSWGFDAIKTLQSDDCA